jgi:formate dehydrogenase, alpha subunit, archaeal-type
MKLLVDGREIDAREGEYLLQALERAGIYVPHVCFNDFLGPVRTCDSCVVKVDGKLVRSCSTVVKEGMIVSVTEAEPMRLKAMDQLLTHHELYCTLCDNNVDCELHEAVMKTHITKQNYTDRGYEVDDSNPFYVYDPNQCILSGRCVEACQDVVVNEVIKIDWDRRRVVWSDGAPINFSSCVSCGTCVTVCPVNALMEKSMLGRAGFLTGMRRDVKEKLIKSIKGSEYTFEPIMVLSHMDSKLRQSLVKRTKTVCPFCGVGCSFEVWTRGREILKVEPKPESPANGIATCIKGKFGLTFVNSEDRLKKPLIRDGNHFREVSWEEAISFIAKKLSEIKEKFGPDSIGVIASCTGTNEEAYLAQRFARDIIGTHNVDNCARYCQAPATTGLWRTVGYGGDAGSIRDIEGADLVLIIGSNTAEAHPVLAGRVKRAKKLRGQKLIVIDVRRHEMAERADLFVTPRIGTDLVLLNGVMKYILDQGWHDEKFISERTVGFKEFAKSLEPYTLDYVERETQVPKDVIVKIATMIHNAKSMVALWAMGVTQHQDGSETSTAISNLLLLTGNYGRPNTGGYPLRGHANVQGVSDFGALPSTMPGYQSTSDENVLRKFEEAWGTKLPRSKGMTSTEMIEAALEGKLKAMIVMGEDKVNADAGKETVRKALSSLDLLVVTELFMTETAKIATVVLPAAASLEKEGTFVNTERRIQRLYKVMEPVGEAKSEFQFLLELSKAMGKELPYRSPEDVMNEASKLCPIFAGVNYERLKGFNSLQWPVLPDGRDSRYLYSQEFAFPDGKAKFYVTTYYKPRAETPTYDLMLVNGRMLEHFHWANLTGRVDGISYKVPEVYLEVSPELAAKRGLKDGDLVMVSSSTGRLKTKVLVSDRVEGNKVFLSLHDSKEMNVNILTDPSLKDPTAKTPAYKETPVYLEKLEDCVSCQPPLPKWNPRYAKRTPQVGVNVELKWQSQDYEMRGELNG